MVKIFQNPLFDVIKEYIAAATNDDIIYIFTPYIKTSVLNEILSSTSAQIIIITSWNTNDLLSNSSELELYPFCIKKNITLYINNNIHLKFYSNGFQDGILSTGNISKRGLMYDGNYECATYIDKIENNNRMFFQNIISKSILVNDSIYYNLKEWLKKHEMVFQKNDYFNIITNTNTDDEFLISALPMTYSIKELITGYAKINLNKPPSYDKEITNCIYHDLANYDIELGLTDEKFLQKLKQRFFNHPFTIRIDEFINPDAYFGSVKQWVQDNCADVPIPSRRHLTNNIQVLYEWFVELGDGKYIIAIPGSHSQRITNIQKL